jgi:hypothetical protein
MHTARCLVIVGFAFVIGCGRSDDQSTKQAEVVPDSDNAAAASFDSPATVFDAFSKAMKDNDWRSAVTMITPESQQMMVTGMVMQSAFMTMEDEAKGKELEQLFKKHGMDEPPLGDEGPSAGDDVDVNALVDNLPDFVGELSAWIEANEDDSEGGFPELGELADLKLDGDTATAVAETEMGPQPIEFRKIDGTWKLHLATGPPPQPAIEDLGLDFEETGEGEIGSMQLGEKTSGLNHAFAYRAKFFDDPCIVLVLTALEVSDEKKAELEEQLKEDAENAVFFADGPSVSLTLTPEGELMSMFVWIDNSSLSGNRGPVVDVELEGDTISGKVGLAPEKFGENELQFKATFETDIHF